MRFRRLKDDLDAFIARDPAARSRLEVALCYPGLHAITLHRLSHALWLKKRFLFARLVSQFARFLTGIEIHPGASIGRRLVIDHGQGVVIGETSQIEDDVTLYQGVTLGGIAPSIDSQSQISVKRHPTLLSGVIVGAGAQILGPIVVGEQARVGANSVVTRDIPPGVTVVGIPAHDVRAKDDVTSGRFAAYGTPEKCPDPVEREIESMRNEISDLTKGIAELSKRLSHIETNHGKDISHRKRGAVISLESAQSRLSADVSCVERGEL